MGHLEWMTTVDIRNYTGYHPVCVDVAAAEAYENDPDSCSTGAGSIQDLEAG